MDKGALDSGLEIVCVRTLGTMALILNRVINPLDYRCYKFFTFIFKLINVLYLQFLSKSLDKIVATFFEGFDVTSNRWCIVGISHSLLNHYTGRSSFACKLLLKNDRDLVVEVRVDCIVILFHSIVPMKLPMVLTNIFLNKALNRIALQNIILNPSLHFMLKL
ncbi:hypothetical protein BOVATA_035290 [Babesia ovata]|uniref:Uncharacterized protein n=1 Tax=Babesia ovata TaxID=189622 RepID=A0A2H6KGC0_9APIC|nr:uncharacterized protein BOVATA_035290 [Babesia ovata]GBE62036.1 hypothetical protein BOVATA_035290 [Babesia ovata]